MAKANRLLSFAVAAALTVGSAASSSVASARASSVGAASAEGSATEQAQAYEPVDSFVIFPRFTRVPIASPYDWDRVDDRTVVIWTSPSTAYLVGLAYPSNDMKFVQAIGVTSSGSRVYAKFDSVLIRGFRYPINSIYKLTRDEAKSLTSRKPGNS